MGVSPEEVGPSYVLKDKQESSRRQRSKESLRESLQREQRIQEAQRCDNRLFTEMHYLSTEFQEEAMETELVGC